MESNETGYPVRRFRQAIRYSIAGMSGISLWTGFTAPQQIQTLASWLPLVDSTWVRIILFLLGFGGFVWVASRPLELKDYKIVGNRLVRAEDDKATEEVTPVVIPPEFMGPPKDLQEKWAKAREQLASDPLKGLRDELAQFYRSWGTAASDNVTTKATHLIYELYELEGEYAWVAKRLLEHLTSHMDDVGTRLKALLWKNGREDTVHHFPVEIAKFYLAQTSEELVEVFVDFCVGYVELFSATARIGASYFDHGTKDKAQREREQLLHRIKDITGRPEFNKVRSQLEIDLSRYE